MSNRTRSPGARRCSVALAVGLASLAIPVASAVAAPVDLQTTNDYSVLGGSTVTNTGSSVLSGDLGVYPGLALPGFGPATVNGAVHAGDADALQAQSDLTTAYNSAAGQTPFTDLSGIDLDGLTLPPGNYSYSGSALLSGTLTLDDSLDPGGQFVFQIVDQLNTASGASVVGPASACNVYWQVGSSATIGTNSSFRGNIMADQSVSMNTGANLIGRALARIGQVSLDDNVINAAPCGAKTTRDTTPGTTAPTAGTPAVNQPAPGSRSTLPTHKGRSVLTITPRARRGTTPRTGPRANCTTGFSARVRGKLIKSVLFSLDGKRIHSDRKSPFQVSVKATAGKHVVSARVKYKDATHAKTMKVRYRGCAAAVLQPHRGPSQFTG
jgi:hypothetical protein